MHKRFGTFVAVEAATFEIPRGQFFSLLGPSGCGKTTLLRMIAGLEEITGGRIRLDGADVSNVPPYRRNVNTVFQHYALFPHMNVFENVAFGPRSKGLFEKEVDRRVGQMLEIVRLGDFAERRPDQLSGGQRQRVALARALVNFPSALLLDEPLSALDLKLRQAMQIELKRIQREVGITFVFVTHDQDEALTMSDRIAVMSEGRIVQVGTPREVYDAPASVFVAGFIGTANFLGASVEAVRGDGALLRIDGGGDAAVTSLPDGLGRGGRAVVMVRPERVRLSLDPPTGNAVGTPVTLCELVFQGPIVRCVLRDWAGNEMVAHVRPDEQPPDMARGAEMWAWWDADACRVLPPAQSPPSPRSTV